MGNAFLNIRTAELCRLLIALGLTIQACAQQQGDPFSTGMILFAPANCPIFVNSVAPQSPASRAGILPGDQLVAVEQTRVTTPAQASRLLHSDLSNPVALKIIRSGRELDVMCGRERFSTIVARAGNKLISGAIVPVDTEPGEVDRMLQFDGKRYVARVFPSHYPSDPNLYYGGFEVFVLKDPSEVTIGGIEVGPASRAGAHWGDVLVSVKRHTCLREQSSSAGTYILNQLEAAKDIAKLNGKRFLGDQTVPSWVSDEDVHCFLK